MVVDQHEPVASSQLVEDAEECFVSPLWFQVTNIDRSGNIVPTGGDGNQVAYQLISGTGRDELVRDGGPMVGRKYRCSRRDTCICCGGCPFDGTRSSGYHGWCCLCKPIVCISSQAILVFVASGFAIIIGVPLAATNHYRKPIYVLGIVLMLAYILGYLSWHLSGHGGFLPNREPLFHGMAPLEALTSHFVSDLRTRISKLSELALLLVLIVLYRRES